VFINFVKQQQEIVQESLSSTALNSVVSSGSLLNPTCDSSGLPNSTDSEPAAAVENMSCVRARPNEEVLNQSCVGGVIQSSLSNETLLESTDDESVSRCWFDGTGVSTAFICLFFANLMIS
jgi:hypothetical protein